MTKSCGDDLIAARRFANLCQARLSDLFTAGEVPVEEILEGLAEIQSQAKLMHARFIYKAAQLVIDDLMTRPTISACVSSVRSLQKLIGQYETGLSEIEPKTKVSPSKNNQVQAVQMQGPAIVSDMARQKTAAQILTPLVKFADERDQQNLVSLLSHAANDTPKGVRKHWQEFDGIMPGVTNSWLRLARAQEKSISVSVSAAGVKFEQAQLKRVRQIFEAVGKAMIIQSIETPASRASQNLSQSAHLAVTLRANGPLADILLSCEGKVLSESVIDALAAKLRDVGGQLTLSKANGIVRAELYQVPVAKDSLAPRSLQEAAV